MLVGGAFLACAMALFNVIEAGAARERRVREPIEGADGFALVLGDSGLLAIAVLLLLTNVVNSTGEFLLSHAVRNHAIALVPDTAHSELIGTVHDTLVSAERREIVKQFYSGFFMWVNVVSFVIQALLVSRIINKIGVRRALFVLPVIAFGAYASIALVGGLIVTRLAKTAENAVDYSLQNTVWQSLFLRTERAVKYKAKATLDSFIVRAGDALSAIIIAVGIHKLRFGPSELAFVNLGLIVVWISVAVWIAHAHRWMGKVTPERVTMRRPTGLIYSGEWAAKGIARSTQSVQSPGRLSG
jgi:AAA family ATP:ADP antiporter